MGALGGLLTVPRPLTNMVPQEALLSPLLSGRGPANSYWYLGHLMSVLLTSEQTGGRYALLRCTERRGLEPPPHLHTREDEAFLLLDGEADYTVGGRVYAAKAGDVMFLPKGIPHAFKIRSATLETLMLLTPGGFERYFAEMGEPAGAVELPPMPQGPPDLERLVATASKYGIVFPQP